MNLGNPVVSFQSNLRKHRSELAHWALEKHGRLSDLLSIEEYVLRPNLKGDFNNAELK